MSSWRQTTKNVVCPAAACLASTHCTCPQGCHKTNLYISITLPPSPTDSAAVFSTPGFPQQTVFSCFFLVLFAVLLVSRATASCLIFTNCFRKRNSFPNFSCLWQPITQTELPVFPLRTSCSAVVFWHIGGIAEL